MGHNFCLYMVNLKLVNINSFGCSFFLSFQQLALFLMGLLLSLDYLVLVILWDNLGKIEF